MWVYDVVVAWLMGVLAILVMLWWHLAVRGHLDADRHYYDRDFYRRR
jgi:hypothetical protein